MDEYKVQQAQLDEMRKSVDAVNRKAQEARDQAAFHRFEAAKLDMIAAHLEEQVEQLADKMDEGED